MIDLLPCPFCGGKPEIRECDDATRDPRWYVVCHGCDVEMAAYGGEPRNSADAWNTRAPVSSVEARRVDVERVSAAAMAFAESLRKTHSKIIAEVLGSTHADEDK